MKTKWLKDDCREAAQNLIGLFPDPLHVRQTIKESTKLIGRDGTTIALLLCNVIPTALHKLAYELWWPVHQLPSNRSTAVGVPSLHRIKSDGTLAKRRGVPKNVLRVLKAQGAAQGTIGYFGAPDQPLHKTPLTKKRPEMLIGNEQLIKLVDELYRQHLHPFYEKQRAVIQRAPQWRLWKTVFSTIYIAKNFRTAYHRDSGNLPGMSALMPMGKFTGGELVIPQWRIAFAFRPGDLLFFDSQRYVHGNLLINGSRLSAIYFCAGRIADCGEL